MLEVSSPAAISELQADDLKVGFSWFRVRGGGGDRSEAWDRETMFSQLAQRSSQNVDSGVCHNKHFRSTINLFKIVCKIYVYFVGGK